MKRFFRFSFVVLFALFILAGCSSSNVAGSKNQPSVSGADRGRRPDFGQPDRPADIRGIVRSLIGNEATILKIDLPSRQASSTPEKGATPAREALSLSDAGAGPIGGQARMPGGDFGGPGGRESRDSQGSGTREQMLVRLKEMSTGEEKIIIPVGIKMMKAGSNSSTGKREMVEATLADITTDKTLMIWLNANNGVNPTATGTSTAESDRKIADFVLIN